MSQTFNMGTHSRIVIKRKRGGNLNFWQHFDGYLEGVGKELCDVIRELLVEFSTEELVIMSNHMVCELVDGDSKFETSMLKDMLIGKSKAKQNYPSLSQFHHKNEKNRKC